MAGCTPAAPPGTRCGRYQNADQSQSRDNCPASPSRRWAFLCKPEATARLRPICPQSASLSQSCRRSRPSPVGWPLPCLASCCRAVISAFCCWMLAGNSLSSLSSSRYFWLWWSALRLQLCYLHIEIHLFLDDRIAGAQRLDLGVAEDLLVHVLTRTDGRFRGHDLSDEALFIFECLEQVRIECPFGDVVVDLNRLIPVALSDDAALRWVMSEGSSPHPDDERQQDGPARWCPPPFLPYCQAKCAPVRCAPWRTIPSSWPRCRRCE